MTINATTDYLKVVLNDRPLSAEMDVIFDYWLKDRDVSSFLTLATKTNASTPVTLIGPLTSDQSVIIESLTITNRDTNPFIVRVYLENAISNYTWRSVTLNAGEVLEFHKHNGWTVYSVSGSSSLVFPVRSTDITADSGNPVLYAKNISGKDILALGSFEFLQESLWNKPLTMYIPQGSTGIWLGTTGGSLGTQSAGVPSTTNVYTQFRRQTFASAATANQQVGTRTENQLWRGNGTGKGGFFAACIFGHNTWTAGNRLFIGVSQGTSAVTTVNPSTLTNIFGFGVDAGDTAITLMHNDATGTATKDVISGQPTLATNQAYIGIIYCKPNDGTIYWELWNLLTSLKINSGAVIYDLPDNSTFLCFNASMGNAANLVAGNATLGIIQAYIRS